MKSFLQNVLFVIFIFAFSNSGLAQDYNNYAVVLGEKTWNDSIQIKANNSIALTIRIDGDGNYYPNYFISDRSMKKSEGKLSNWYSNSPKQFEAICENYKLPSDSLSLDLLNYSIEKRYVHLIDSLSSEKKIVFLIHGYRKQMYDQKDNVLSTVNNDSVEAKMGNNKLFIEVYWDSKYISKFKSIFGKKGFKLMESSATQNARNVGNQLRTLISSLKDTNIAILTHSLGAIVANEIAFNYGSNSSLMNNKNLKIAYLGPAVGHEAFEKANLRGVGNYKLSTCIAYNEDDFVLQKQFGIYGMNIETDATSYGVTSLGCNFKDDIGKLLNMYQKTFPNEITPVIVNMSGERIHHFPNYVNHKKFTEVMEFLFGKK